MTMIDLSKPLVRKSIIFFGLLLGGCGSAFAEGQFSQGCHNLELRLPYLHARCKGILHTENRTRININNYIGIHEGQLIWQRYGNFTTNAKLCSLVGTIMGCAVFDSNKKIHYSVINLDEHIGNFYGNLIFQGP